MNLFSSAGLIVQLQSDAQLLGIYLQDIYDPQGVFNFNTRLAIITSSVTKESSLYQLRMMFNNKLYLNVFGDNPGVMSISGLFAGGGCGSTFVSGQPATSGFELMSAYYRQHRLSNRMLSLPVTIGGFMTPMVYETFLAECQLSTMDPQLQIGQFSMSLVYPMHSANNDSTGEEFEEFPDSNDDPSDPGSPGDMLQSDSREALNRLP